MATADPPAEAAAIAAELAPELRARYAWRTLAPTYDDLVDAITA